MVWTYGPLGFLKVPSLWYLDTGLLAIAYRVVTHLALLCVLFAMARRSFNVVVAAVIVLIAGTQIDDALPILAFALGLWLVLRPPSPAATPWIALVAGMVAGEELLGKVNTGVTVAALLGVALIALPGRPWARLAIFGAGALVSLLVLWVAIGEPLSALDDYALNSARVVSGYSVGQATEDPSRTWEYSAALIVTVAVTAGMWLGTAALPLRARLGALALWAVLAFLSFKAGFVRHDAHSQQFFAATLLALPAFPWPRERRLVGLLVFALALTAFIGVSGQRLRDMLTPIDRGRTALTDLRLLVEPSRARAIRDSGRVAVQQGEALDPSLLALLQGHTVHVLPTEAAVPWAFSLPWRPLPIMQGYQAYTPALDHLNATALTGPRAPERVLLNRLGGLDGRYTPWDEPETTRTLLCRYRPLRDSGDWLVLRPRDESLRRAAPGGQRLRRLGPAGAGPGGGAGHHGVRARGGRVGPGPRAAALALVQGLRADCHPRRQDDLSPADGHGDRWARRPACARDRLATRVRSEPTGHEHGGRSRPAPR